MSDNGKTGVLMIKTAEKQEDIISNGMVTLNMRLNLDRVDSECKYVICCQDNAEESEDLFTDNSGYLIGVISDTRRLPNGSAVIYLSQFATIYREKMWTKQRGMAVQYFAAPSECGMYVGRVQFKPMDNRLENATSEIAQAVATPVATPIVTLPKKSFPDNTNIKATIANAFGFKPDEVESACIVFKVVGGKITVEV